MAVTYKAIATVTVGSGGAASIDFTSIPGTYTDLQVVISARSAKTTGGSDGIGMSINGVTTNRTWRELFGDGSTAASYSGSTSYVAIIPQNGGTIGWTSNTFGSASIYIPNYTSANNKSFSVDNVTENNATTSYQEPLAGLWSNTAVITSLSFTTLSALNFVQYSTATLYGIKKD